MFHYPSNLESLESLEILEALQHYNDKTIPYSSAFRQFDPTDPRVSWSRHGNFIKLTGLFYKIILDKDDKRQAELYVYGQLFAKIFLKICIHDYKLTIVEDNGFKYPENLKIPYAMWETNRLVKCISGMKKMYEDLKIEN